MNLKFLSYLSLFIILIFSCTSSETNTLYSKVKSSKSNVKFKNILTDSEDFNVMKYGYFYNGAGVATADFNNDGFLDLYFTANIGDDRLYINKGDGSIGFEDITDKAGIKIDQGWKTGVSVVDINDDGWMDIYVCRSAAENPQLRRNLLFINNKNLTFTESAAAYGLDDPGYSTQAAFFDYDKDGDLDCFILNHSIQKYAGFNQSLKSYKSVRDPHYSSRLMQNNGGKYTEVTQQAGLISNVLSFGLGVMVSDYNHDGWLDIYVSNDYNEEDYLYINQQDGTFAETIRDATTHTSLFSMGSDAADINDDGTIDLMTLDMLPEKNERIKMTSGDDNYEKYQNLLSSGFHQQYMRNMLQINSGNHAMYKTPKGMYIPQFNEVGQFSGVSNTDWSWSALIADYDNDGAKDIFVTNGYEKDYTNMDFLSYTVDLQTKNTGGKINEMDVISKMPSIKESNYIFRNNGNLQFINEKQNWGFVDITNSSGAVYADLDNDGDLDLVTNNLNVEAGIYQNNTNEQNNFFLKVKLSDASQSLLIGTKVYAYFGSKIKLVEYIPVRGYQSSAQQALHIGLGKIDKLDSIKIVWMDDTVDKILNPPLNQTFNVKKGEHSVKNIPYIYQFNNTKIFALDYLHKSDYISDFKLQSLLPYAVSSTSPKIAKSSNEQLIYICGNKNQYGTSYSYINNSFKQHPIKNLNQSPSNEGAAVFIDIDKDGDEDIVVTHYVYDTKGSGKVESLKLLQNNGNHFEEKRDFFGKDLNVNSTCIIALDYDNDNDNDLFIGGRLKPEQYPQSVPSVLLTNNGKGSFDVQKGHSFDIGMITDAVYISNADGLGELVLSREWNSVIKLRSENGQIDFSKFESITDTGLWLSLAKGDLNNDGKTEIFAGNIGLNNQLQFVSPTGLTLYDFPFLNIAKSIPLLCISEDGEIYPFAARDELLSQTPVLKKKFFNYETYAKANATDVYGDEINKAKKYSANTFKSTFIQNQKSNEPFDLPYQVQLTPVKTCIMADLNGDGYTDMITAGSIYNPRVRIGLLDGSDVSIFLNTKKGNFTYHSDLGIKGQIDAMILLKNKGSHTLLTSRYNATINYVEIKL